MGEETGKERRRAKEEKGESNCNCLFFFFFFVLLSNLFFSLSRQQQKHKTGRVPPRREGVEGDVRAHDRRAARFCARAQVGIFLDRERERKTGKRERFFFPTLFSPATKKKKRPDETKKIKKKIKPLKNRPNNRDTAQLYAQLAEAGLQYGPAFRLLRNVHVPEEAMTKATE